MNNIENDFGLPKISEDLDKEEFDYRNKYRNIYIRLIIRCQNMTEEELSGYNERHHILPKCLGGKNNKENLVLMPVRYHMMAHILLITIYPNIRGLKYAIKAVLDGSSNIVDRAGLSQKYFSSRTLAFLREETKVRRKEDHPNWGKHLSEKTKSKISDSHKGKKLSEETKAKMSKSRSGPNNPNYGKTFSEEWKKHLSESHKGYITSEETKKKLSIALSGPNNPNYGKTFSEEWRQKISDNHRDVSGSNNPRARKVLGPDGTIYGCIKDAVKMTGIPLGTITKWLRGITKSNHGWSFYNENNNSQSD